MLDSFPTLPQYTAIWTPIYFEPIINSGERITIGLIAFNEAKNDKKVIKTVKYELLECIYGLQAVNINDLIDITIKSIEFFLDTSIDVKNWNPPMQGVYLGTLKEASDYSLSGIFKQALIQSSSLGSLAMLSNHGEDDIKTKKHNDTWAQSIFTKVLNIDNKYKSNIRRKIEIGTTGTKTTYHFMTNSYVSNMGMIFPHRLSSSINIIKAKLLDLETLYKSNYIFKPTNYELIFGIPSKDDPLITKKTMESIYGWVEHLNEIASKENISIFTSDSNDDIAEHLIESAA